MALVKGKGALTRSTLQPGLCLLCGVPAVFHDLEGNVIKREPDSPVYSFHTLFVSLCRCLDIPKDGPIRKTWDFEKDPFPFCDSCEELMGSLVDLYRQVEQMEKNVKTKGLKGASKFIPLSKFDVRTQQFRNAVDLCDKKRQPGPVQNTQTTQNNDKCHPVLMIKLKKLETLSSFTKPCTSGSKQPKVEPNDNDDPCVASSDAEEVILEPESEISPLPSPCDDYGDDPTFVELDGKVPSDKEACQYESIPSNDNHNDPLEEDSVEMSDGEEWSPRTKRRRTTSKKTDTPKAKRIFPKNKCCPTCPLKFPSNSDLKQHMRSQHGLAKLKCDLCPAEFVSRWGLGNHRKIVHLIGNLQTFQCHICSRSFSCKSSLNEHFFTHSDTYNFSCEICGVKTRTRSTLRSHRRDTHPEKKDHICPTCSMAFCTKTKLRTHMAVHSEDRDYMCDMCPSSYKGSARLAAHKKKAHSDQNEDVVNT